MKGITTNQEMDYSVNTLVEAYADRHFVNHAFGVRPSLIQHKKIYA
jgi:hypothetical protein